MLCDLACGAVSRPWFVVQTEPCAEFVALRGLQKDWLKSYLPLEVKHKQMMKSGRPVFENGKRRTVEALHPFFRGYLFSSFDPSIGMDVWGKISRTEGVKRLFMSSSLRPIALRAGVVESIMDMGRAGDGAIDLDAPAFPTLSPGDAVTIRSGAFADRNALVEADDGERVCLLMSALGTEVRVTAPRASVVAAGQKAPRT